MDLVWVAIVISIITVLLFYVFMSGFIWGAGYEPVPKRSLLRMIELSSPKEGNLVYDLGSGFGRIVIEVAKRTGARCIGIEIDPLKCWWSKFQIKRKKLEERAQILRMNIMDANLKDADIVFLFLWGSMMEKLKEKLVSEMRPGSLVVSYWHRFRGWEPEHKDEKLRVYLYRIPEKDSPKFSLSLSPLQFLLPLLLFSFFLRLSF